MAGAGRPRGTEPARVRTVWLPDRLVAQLDERAAELGTSRNALIRVILEEAVTASAPRPS